MQWMRNRVVLAGVVVLVVAVALVVLLRRSRDPTTPLGAFRAERIAHAEQETEEQARAQREERERTAQRELAGIAQVEREEAEREALAREEQQRLAEQAERDLEKRRRTAAEQARRDRERLAEQERLAATRAKEEEERRLAAETERRREAEELAGREQATKKPAEEEASLKDVQAAEEQEAEKQDDDTPEVETDSTIDNVEASRGWRFNGDLRPIYDASDSDNADGSTTTDHELGFRWRVGAEWGITTWLRAGARLAGLCYVDDCEPDFVMDTATPGPSGLVDGQITLDQLYLHGFRKGRFDVAVGRLQTRFVLRGGVYAKSLDRNDSNNVNVTWTDGMHATFRGRRGWASHFVLQRNASDGTGSIRHGLLDFDDSSARNSYFLGTENIGRWGPVVQRGFDASYLPASLLVDGDPGGRREDYWGLVARLAMRWPQRREGPRLRAGLEVGYAPETPTAAAVDLTGSVSGLAWNVVISAIEFKPTHSIGLNYARTGPAWYLSPQYNPNEELVELRYQWRPERFPLLEARVRRRDDLEQEVGTLRKASELDLYVRLTWEFTIKDFPSEP